MVDRWEPHDFDEERTGFMYIVNNGDWVEYDEYKKLAQDYKILNQINEASDNAYQNLMFDYQSLLIEYGKLFKRSE